MSVIVRPFWSPPANAHVAGTYGERCHDHPRLKEYVWVNWLDSVGVAGGYYEKAHLRVIGTALTGAESQ